MASLENPRYMNASRIKDDLVSRQKGIAEVTVELDKLFAELKGDGVWNEMPADLRRLMHEAYQLYDNSFDMYGEVIAAISGDRVEIRYINYLRDMFDKMSDLSGGTGLNVQWNHWNDRYNEDIVSTAVLGQLEDIYKIESDNFSLFDDLDAMAERLKLFSNI